MYTEDLRHYRRTKALHSQNGGEGGALPGAGPNASSGDTITPQQAPRRLDDAAPERAAQRKPKPARATGEMGDVGNRKVQV